MKNIQGKEENLKLYNRNGVLVYEFYKDFDGYWESTYDDNGNELTFKNSNGDWIESTYDDNDDLLTFKDSNGVSRGFDIPEYTMEELTKIVGEEMKNILGKSENLKLYNDKGSLVYEFYTHSTGYWAEKTYDDKGNCLTYKNYKGESRGFDIPEYTMEQLTKIVGKEFKIKK